MGTTTHDRRPVMKKGPRLGRGTRFSRVTRMATLHLTPGLKDERLQHHQAGPLDPEDTLPLELLEEPGGRLPGGADPAPQLPRSEERRVGKEGSERWRTW